MDNRSTRDELSTLRQRLEALVARVERRVRLQRALDWATLGGLLYAMAMSIVVVLYKTGWMEPSTFWWIILGLLVVPVALFGLGWFGDVERVSLAQRIDRSHALHDRLSTAVSLLEQGKETAFARAQYRDALRHSDDVDTAGAAPFRRPRDLKALGVFVAALAALALFEPPSHTHPLPRQPEIRHDRVLDEATVAMERDRLERLRGELEEVDDPEAEELVEEIDDLLDDVEEREISEREFLDRIDQIEEEYFDQKREEDAKELTDKLEEAAESLQEEAGEDLEDQPEFAEAVEALQERDLEEAAKAVDELAEKLKDGDLDEDQAEQLADLVESFADKIDPEDSELRELVEEHRDLVDELSDEFEGGDGPGEEEKRRLDREKEKLADLEEQLDGQQNSESSRQLKQLKRSSEEMAEKLRGEDEENSGDEQDSEDDRDGESEGSEEGEDERRADGSEQNQQDGDQSQQSGREEEGPDYRQEAGRMAEEAARELERGDQRNKGEEARQQARKQLDEMKESMRRSRSERAEGGEGKDGESSRGEEMREYLDRARGEEGREGEEGGQEAGRAPEDVDGEMQEGDALDGEGQMQEGGDQAQESNSAGQGAGDRELGDETDLDSEGEESRVEGRSGEGPSKSEIIKAASEEGFANTEYKDVYVDYESVAEETMDREEVPAGYRYYIKRYFELIKPRE